MGTTKFKVASPKIRPARERDSDPRRRVARRSVAATLRQPQGIARSDAGSPLPIELGLRTHLRASLACLAVSVAA
eukprot:2215410-Pleurochrysis_carterae.AAC.2